ncbi:MAG: heparinase II/III family protein [Fimbriimonadaceae bacterium]|nr:heparinase II/III family protein [Fimbriimonadaceae bacterium]
MTPWTTFALLGLLLTVAAAEAEPATLYKPRNLAIARQNLARYAWAKSLVAGWQRQTRLVLERDRAWLEELVPQLTPGTTYGQTCPVCVGEKSAMGETALVWDVLRPDEIKCKYCSTVFPHPDYPETGRLECPRMGQSCSYYLNDAERANPADVSGKLAFRWASWPMHTSWSGAIRERRAGWVAGQVAPLTQLYAVTGEAVYAERLVWCLDALAKAWPGWLLHSYNGTIADCPPAVAAAELGRNPRAGKFAKELIVTAFPHLVDTNKDGFGELNNGFWGAGQLHPSAGSDTSILFDCAVAYDLLRDARDAAGQPLLPAAERQRIERDLLLAGADIWANYREINNKCGPGRAFAGAIAILFGRPDQARFAIEGFERLIEEAFHFDGFCRESPSYSNMHLALMADIPEVLAGYSDPPGYQPPAGERFDQFDPHRHVPRYRLALESMVRALAPDGKCPVIGDTHVGTGVSAEYAEVLTARYGNAYAELLQTALGAPLAERGSAYALFHRDPELRAGGDQPRPLRSEWFPGWQVAVLRGGLAAASPTALYLNASAYHGHRHHDTLGLVYYDHGRELASDRGYIWDDPRNAWTRSTLAHNIVTVDGQDQVAGGRTAALELYANGPGIEVVQAASPNAYAQCREYRRTLALVRVSPQQTYAVDLFRVAGGRRHTWGLQANGRLTDLSGPAPEPLEEKLSWLTNLRQRRPAPAGAVATWQVAQSNLELRLLSDADRLILADAPGWRSYKGDQLHAPPIQQILAERTGTDLSSRFVALLTPYQGAGSPVRAARLLPGEPADESAVALRIELADRTDLLVLAPDATPRRYGELTVAGRVGYLSLGPDGQPRAAWLLGGTALRYGAVQLSAPAAQTERAVRAVDGLAITLDAPLPPAARAGQYLLAGGTGFEIAALDGPRVTVRDYPPPAGLEQVSLLSEVRWPAAE